MANMSFCLPVLYLKHFEFRCDSSIVTCSECKYFTLITGSLNCGSRFDGHCYSKEAKKRRVK